MIGLKDIEINNKHPLSDHGTHRISQYFAYNLATKSADSIREKLKTAMERKSRPSLERAINEAEAAKYPELAYDLRQARDTLESLGGGRGG